MFPDKKSILVIAPVDKVFSYIADLSRHREWDGDTWLDFQKVSSQTTAVGTRCYRQGTKDTPGSGIETITKDVEVTEFVSNKSLAFKRVKSNSNWPHLCGGRDHRPALPADLRSTQS